MKVLYGIKEIRKFPRPVVALGVFDGVHRGHRKILEAAVRQARQIRGTAMVFTFWPHPQKQQSLYSLEHRLRLIGDLGIDVALVVRLSKGLAEISAQDFIRNFLVEKLNASHIFVGSNYKFGKGGRGDCAALRQAAREYQFTVKVFPVSRRNGLPVSSTLIRTLIKRGDLVTARRLLSRRVSVLGTVVRGISFGRKLGIPTANIDPHHEVIPPQGVYAVKLIWRRKNFKGVCYIGPKPAFLKHPTKENIEVHILDFNKTIYGETLEIQFIRKIRAPRKFSAPAPLAAQIRKDILESQAVS